MSMILINGEGFRFGAMRQAVDSMQLKDIAIVLSRLCRFNGHTNDFYSVAQHSVLVSYMVPEEFALEALLHDAAEVFLGDMVRPLKSLDMLQEYRKREVGVDGLIRRRFKLPATMSRAVEEADDKALAVEFRDLMPYTPTGIEVSTWPDVIECQEPKRAALSFIMRYAKIVENQPCK